MRMRRFIAPFGMLVVLTASGCDGGYEPPAEAEPMDSIAPMPNEPAVRETDEPGE